MKKTINPDSMYESTQFGFSHVVRSGGCEYLHCAGQVSFNKNGEIVGINDLKAQLEQAFGNLNTVLTEAGSSPANVVQLRTYIVNHKPDYLDDIIAAVHNFYGGSEPAANTLIGVQSLALPELLVEVEAIAVLD